MADLPSIKAKLNDVEVSADAPDTQALWQKTGSSISYLIDKTDNLGFTSVDFSFTQSWTVPQIGSSLTTRVEVMAIGGGGGGAGGGSGQQYGGGGGSGGEGCLPIFHKFNMTANQIILITIGTGGSGGAGGPINAEASNGGVGGDTYFHNMIQARGGRGGIKGDQGIATVGGSGGASPKDAYRFNWGLPGGDGGKGAGSSAGVAGSMGVGNSIGYSDLTFVPAQTSGGSPGTGFYYGGGGGSGGGGISAGAGGGNGGSSGVAGATGGSASSGRGAGGGGGGGGCGEAASEIRTVGGAGGSGAPGYVRVWYFTG